MAKRKKRKTPRNYVRRVQPTGLLAWGAKRMAVAFRIHPEIVEGLTDAAAVQGMTRNRLVEAVLFEYVNGRKPGAEDYAVERVDNDRPDLFA